MPIIKSAIKRAKQTIKRRERNISTKKDIKSATKAFIAKPTAATLAAAHSEIDTAVKKGWQVDFAVPLLVETDSGQNWDEAH